jgi:hypothetical protein
MCYGPDNQSLIPSKRRTLLFSTVAAKACTSWKRSAVLCGKEEVGEYLLLSESVGSLSYSEYNTDNELNDHALLDVVVNTGSDEDDNIM